VMMQHLNSSDEPISIYPNPCRVLSTNPTPVHNVTATLPYLRQSYDRPLFPEGVQAMKERAPLVKEIPKGDKTKKRSERVNDGDIRSEKNKRIKPSTDKKEQQKGSMRDSGIKLPRSGHPRYRFMGSENKQEPTSAAPARPRIPDAVTVVASKPRACPAAFHQEFGGHTAPSQRIQASIDMGNTLSFHWIRFV
jgi:hypothetical protein